MLPFIIITFNIEYHRTIIEIKDFKEEDCKNKISNFIKKINSFNKENIKNTNKLEIEFKRDLAISMFCTVKLIENTNYPKIVDNEKEILDGIKTINFFAGQIIKFTWNDVKKGEKRSKIALRCAFGFLMILVALAIFFGLKFMMKK